MSFAFTEKVPLIPVPACGLQDAVTALSDLSRGHSGHQAERDSTPARGQAQGCAGDENQVSVL